MKTFNTYLQDMSTGLEGKIPQGFFQKKGMQKTGKVNYVKK